jgi:hypothetical protein
MNQAPRQSSALWVSLSAAACLCAAAAGCQGNGGGSQGSAQSPGPIARLFGAKDPNAPLTDEEGAKLLEEIHSNPARLQKLTPAERHYLAQYGAAANKKRRADR